MEDERQFVHQRNVQVSLRVFDDLGGLCNHDAGRAINTGGNNLFVRPGDAFQRFWRVTGYYFDYSGQGVLAIARVDSLRRIADEKVSLPQRSGLAFENGNADFLR